MSIDQANMEKIKQEIHEGIREKPLFKPVSLPQLLRERFQDAADAEMNGDFTHLLETVLRLYLEDPRNFPVCWVRQNEGTAKNKPVNLSDEVIKGIKAEAEMLTDGVFARLVQIIVRGYLVDRGYIKQAQ